MKSRLVSWTSVWILSALAFVLVVATVVVGIDEVINAPSSASQSSQDDWPSYLHDLQHTGASPENTFTTSNVAGLVKLWSFHTGAPIAASATVVNNTVYIGSWDGYEYALDASTGTLKWKTYLGITTLLPGCSPAQMGVTSSAAVLNGTLYVGGGDSYWYALDAATGKPLWKVFTGDNSPQSGFYNWASSVLYQGYAYVSRSGNGCINVFGQLLKVSLSTHQIVGTINLVPNGQQGAEVWGTPSVDTATNTLYVTTGNDTTPTQPLAQAFIAIDLSTFKIKDSWQDPKAISLSDSDIGTSPTLFTDAAGVPLVAATGKDGVAYALKRDDLSAGPVWEDPIAITGDCPECGQGSVSSGAFGNGTLYLAGGNTTINGVGYLGSVRALDPATGKYLWQHGTDDVVLAGLAYTNGLVLDGAGATLEVLSASTGQRLFSYQTGGPIYSAPSIAEGKIFFGSTDGNVYALHLPSSPPASPAADAHCPPAWTCQDIGNPTPAGAESMAQTIWNVRAGGTGFDFNSDQGRFLAQTVSGDTQISAQVISQQGIGGGTPQSGLMIRQDAAPGSPYYGVLFKPGSGITVQYRFAMNGGTTSSLHPLPAHLPLYLEIQRVGDLFQAAYSTDGSAYTLVPGSSTTLVMPTKALVGLAASSGKNATFFTATFGSVTIGAPTSAPVPPPLTSPCPTRWNCASIGNPDLVGSQTLAGGTWSIQGAGIDINGSWDQFQYVWQSLAGDGSISAQFTAQTATDPSAKAGVMLRAGTTANAAYYAVFVTPGGGIQVQYRPVPGMGTQNVIIPGTTPVYVRVTRAGNTFTAYSSANGLTWTAVPDSSFTLTMPTTLLAGIAVSSHNAAQLCTVTVNNVQIG